MGSIFSRDCYLANRRYFCMYSKEAGMLLTGTDEVKLMSAVIAEVKRLEEKLRKASIVLWIEAHTLKCTRDTKWNCA